LAQGQLSYLESDGKIYVYSGTAWVSISSVTNVAAFTASGTWTVPAGVTYAIAHIRGAGGGTGTANAGNGGSSSVAFASGTITANGGLHIEGSTAAGYSDAAAGAANSGQGAGFTGVSGTGVNAHSMQAMNGAEVVAGAAVTPAASITVTVGAGGTAGTSGAAGGSGYVWIEFQV
jgi:hypothetical protein